MFKSKISKSERRAKAKKEAEKLLKISQDPKISKGSRFWFKIKSFFNWVFNLLTPDSFIGYPSLGDNLKTLRKHPYFKPLRVAIVCWLIFTIVAGPLFFLVKTHSVRADSTWYNTSWPFRKKITFDNSSQAENLTDFTVLVKLDKDTDIDYSKTQDLGQDLRFTDSDGTTLLKYEIETWDETGSSYVWVKVPQIDASSATDYIYMYYGNNNATDGQDIENTWNSNYKMVQHFKEASGTFIDSTTSSNDGTQSGGVTYGASGQIGKAVSLDGNDDYISISNSASINFGSGPFTLVGYFKSTYRTYAGFLSKNGSFNNNAGWSLTYAGSPQSLYALVGNGSAHIEHDTGIKNLTAWTQVGLMRTADNKIYIIMNGVMTDTGKTLVGSVDNTTIFKIGKGEYGGGVTLNGSIDEVSAISNALTVSEIAAKYKSESDTFNTFGSEESTNTNPDTPTVVSPESGATNQSLTPVLEASVFNDADGDTHVASQWQISDVSGFYSPAIYDSGADSTNKTSLTVPAGNLSIGQKYYWHVRYQDSMSLWSEYSSEASFTVSVNPAVPTIISPEIGALSQDLETELVASDFSDTDTGSSQTAAQWLVRTNSDPTYASPVFDSETDTENKTSLTLPAGTLEKNTIYYWKVRYRDDQNMWSDYSSEGVFSTGISPLVAVAVGATEYTTGETARLTIQVKDADGSAVNSASSLISIFDSTGDKIVTDQAMEYLADSNGLYVYSYLVPETVGVYTYDVSATFNSSTSYSAHAFHVAKFAEDITAIRTMLAEEQTAQAAERLAQESERSSQAAERLAQTGERTSQVAERLAEAASRLETTQIKQNTEAGIVDSPKNAKIGSNISIKYKAQSGLSGSGAPKLNLYDGANVLRVSNQVLAEMGSTGIYSINVDLLASWTTGFFTVLIDESTNNTSGNAQIFVGTADFDSLKTDLTNLKDSVDGVAGNMDVLIGALIVTQGSVAGSDNTVDNFGTSLTNTTNDFYKNSVLTFTSGNLNGSVRRISNYSGSTKRITLDPVLPESPAVADTFTIVKQNVRVEEQVKVMQSDVSTIKGDVSAIKEDTMYIRNKVDSVFNLLEGVDTKLDTAQSALNVARLSQQKVFQAKLSDIASVQAGTDYRAKLTLLDFESNPVDATTTPTISIYDADRNLVVTGASMTRNNTGIYEYVYSVGSEAAAGNWEAIVTTAVGSSNNMTVNDYFTVGGAPAQVLINSISDLIIPSIAASITITNEGNEAYEYQYTWCVVSSPDNQCGGSDDIYHASAAKLIQPGTDFDTTLTATVPNAGNYWFKLLVSFGSQTSSASRYFTAQSENVPATPNSPSGSSSSVAPNVSNQNQISNESIYASTNLIRQDLQAQAQKISQALSTLELFSPAFQEILTVNTENTKTFKDISNKLADLRSISATTKRLVEEKAEQPIVETYMKFNSVEMHFVIVNPGDTKQTIDFKSYLPVEVKPEHIINSNGLKVDYDAGASTYFVSASISLEPKESVTRKVEMKDIWVFNEDEIQSTIKKSEEIVGLLKNTQYETQAILLKQDIEDKLNALLKRQTDSYISPQDHIVAYRENQTRFNQAQLNFSKLQDLATSASNSKNLVGQVGGIETFSTWGIILVILLGFGLLSAVIFAMWKHQMTLSMMALGLNKKKARKIMGCHKAKRKFMPA